MRRTVKEALKRKQSMEAKPEASEKTGAKANALVTETITEQPPERTWAKKAKVDDERLISSELDPVQELQESTSSNNKEAEEDSEEPPVTQVIFCKLKRRQETTVDEEPAEASPTSEVIFDGADDAETPEMEVGPEDLPQNITDAEEPDVPLKPFGGKCLIYSEDQERKEEDASDLQWQDEKLLIVRLCMVKDESYLRSNSRNPDGTFRSLISLKAHNYEETDPENLRVAQYEWNRLEERLYNMKLKSHYDSKGRLAGWVSEKIQISIEL